MNDFNDLHVTLEGSKKMRNLSTMDIVRIASGQVDSWNRDKVNDLLDETGIMESELILLHAMILFNDKSRITPEDLANIGKVEN